MFWNRNTKFHQIILIGIFSILVGSDKPFKILSPDENQNRLKNCGKFQLLEFSPRQLTNNEIIIEDSFEKYKHLHKLVPFTGWWFNATAVIATATAISPYHIFTSSYVVLDEKKNWRYINQAAQCSSGSADLNVPPKVLEAFNHLPLTRARILNVCNSTSNQFNTNEDVSRKLMLAEIKHGNFSDYFCLSTKTTSKREDLLYSYGRSWTPDVYKLYNRQMKFDRYSDDKVITQGYRAKDDFANALVKQDFRKGWLMGIGMGAIGWSNAQENAYFYKVEYVQNKICSLAGICNVPIITTTTSTTTPSTTTTTTTQTPTTPSTSSEEPNTTISATSATMTQPKPSPTSISTRIPEDSEPRENPNRRLEMDVDEEYEEYLARKKESEKDYEDVDDDIVVSRDFFAKAGKPELPDNEFNKDNETILNDTGILKELVNYTGVWIDNPQSAFYATATAISPHHVLTSSYVVIDIEGKWRYTQKQAKCSSDSVDLDVPSEVLAVFNRSLRLAEARILNVCNSSNQLVEDFNRKLVLAEIKEGNLNNYFCLANEITSQHGDMLYSYGRAWDPNYYQLYVRKLTFDKFLHDIIVTKGYKAKDDFASALVEEKYGKHMVLGIGMGFKGQTTGEGQAWFYSIVKFQEKICALAGICDVPIITTTTSTTPPTTTTTTTTQTPTTPSTTSEKPNTTTSTASATIPLPKPSPTSIPSTILEPSEPQENSNRRLEIDVDEEYEEYLARKKESEKDYEDVDDDIVVSRDFFTKAGQRELSVFVLVLIIVMVFV
ncbi:hypothetical protein B9Z55_003020 [Caenorhabditis nigoni]|nr:hypothetical protein B9Z55_003020 [Caenorhabditis nigoni]